ncbi:hypothetical protein D3C73_954160 [compost metagenome]
MVVVVATHLQVEVQAAGIAQRTEEVRDQLGRHVAHALALELAFKHEIRAATEIQRSAGQGFIHRQGETVAADAALVAQCFAQGLAQRKTGVFDGVVFVDVQIALGADIQRETTVLADLFQHMVEERQAGVDVRIAGTIQIQFDTDLRFLGIALDHRRTRRIGQCVGNARPVPLAAELLGAQLEATDVEVVGELQVGDAVADHARARPVDAAVLQVGGHQANARLARRRVVVRPAAVDQHITENDALAFEDLQHQVIRAIEAGARIAFAAQTILIGDDHELVAGIAQFQQRRDHLRHEAQLLVGIDLEIRRFLDEGAVAVDEQDGRHAAALRADRTASTRSFSSGLPMLIRSASPNCGAARWSRTTTPAASSASNAAWASAKRTSR